MLFERVGVCVGGMDAAEKGGRGAAARDATRSRNLRVEGTKARGTRRTSSPAFGDRASRERRGKSRD
jgi:hypothetical protein